MQVDALAVRLRPRTPMEAADLGVRLCQSAAGSIVRSYGIVALPMTALALASYEIAAWLPPLVMWCAKPWLDRTILFVLSRAAFGQPTGPSDVWNAQRQVWWSQLPFTWTVRRLSPWRSFTQPVYQLEGLSIRAAGARVRQIRQRHIGSALMMTQAFSLSELALTMALVSLVFWLAPEGRPADLLAGELPGVFSLALPVAYAVAVLFLEPFYVAAGFAMYLNRRAELEAWDIEQEFRRAFKSAAAAIVLILALSAGAAAAVPQTAAPSDAGRPSDAEIARAIQTVKADPNLATERTIKMLHWKRSDSPPSNWLASLRWIAELFGWLERSARVLVWVAAGLLAVLLALHLVRTMRWRGVRRAAKPFVAPSRVQDLDIRPESLPDDIGAAARALWDRGEHRAALALLYRGMLSRLAHVYRIPIRDSSTEGDCLGLAAHHLPQEGREYALRLVPVWQRFVYGGRDTPAATVYVLCDDFAPALDRPSPARARQPGGPA